MKFARQPSRIFAAAALLLSFAVHVKAQTPATAPPPGAAKQQASADALTGGMLLLHQLYLPAKGLYAGTGWWNSANGITVLADYEALRADKTYEADIANTFNLNKAGGFLNNFYDDEGWWALAWIAAFDRTGNVAYLRAAESIFNDMAGGWDETCGGGIWWSKDRKYKNAIANELFLSVASALAQREAGREADAHLAWAVKEWTWFRGTGLINPQHLINDGLTASCANNGQPAFTYNQGVILGGLATLSLLQKDAALLTTARGIADAAIAKLVDANGILHEPCEPQCGEDGPQFKGIFVRNLQALQAVAPASTFRSFLAENAASLKQNDSSGAQFGLIWSGPYQDGGASPHISGLDLLIAEEASR